jgi:arginyl-tRNA synthetase
VRKDAAILRKLAPYFSITMIAILEAVQLAVQQAVKELYETDLSVKQLQLQRTRKEFEGEFTVVVFPIAGAVKRSPEVAGNEIGQWLVQHRPEIAKFNVVKGFLNLVLSDKYWQDFFHSAWNDERFGYGATDSLPRVLVEFASPNTNKPLHLGHLRNIFLGDAVSYILAAKGHKVTRVQIINDRGIHICKSMLAWQKFGNGETPESIGVKGDKLVGKYYVRFDQEFKAQQKELVAQGKTEKQAEEEAPILLEAKEMLRKWEANDAEVVALWKKMNDWVYVGFNGSYTKMGVSFDKLYYESDTYLLGRDEVMNGLRKGVFFQKDDGSIWIDLSDEGLDQKAVLRKDGTAMYITQDIGTAILRFRDYPDTDYQIYTVGNEQDYHFKVLFKILKKLGFRQGERCFHLSYGMVELPEGKMKSREGTVVDADDLMDEMRDVAREVAQEQGKLEGIVQEEKEVMYHTIGMAALKYFLLKVDPVKNMLFNPKESIDFNGNTGPFILYTYVRTRAIQRKAAESGLVSKVFQLLPTLAPEEKTLLRRLHDFPEVISEAAESHNPASIAHFVYELAREFNVFYHECPVLKESDEDIRRFRIALSVKTGDVISSAFSLLGIRTVDRM